MGRFSVRPPPLGHPARHEAQPARPEAQPARSEAQPARSEAQTASQASGLRLQAWLDGQEGARTDGQPAAQRHQMVSGSLALLFFLLGFHEGRQGSGPDRERSPVEWGDFPSVCSYVRPSGPPPSGPSSKA